MDPNEPTCEPYSPDCFVTYSVGIIGGKWKLIIIYYLLQKTRRFNELRRLIPGITQQMLTLQLRELEHDGIIHREIYPQVPPKVEYSLTPQGRALEAILSQLHDWGAVHRQQQNEQALMTEELLETS